MQNAKTQYEKAKILLDELIQKQKEERNFLLPTESELVDQLQIGRNTIRRVVGEMVDGGYIERIQGKGSFIVEKDTKLNFSNWVSLEQPANIAITRVLSDFEKHNKNIEIHSLNIPYHLYRQRLFQLYLKGNGPDVIQITPYWLQYFLDHNLLQPLDEIVNKNNLNRRFATDIESVSLNNQIYALNWTLCPLVLYYNKVVLEKAGLDPEKPPQTLDELLQMCIKINSVNNAYGICLPLKSDEPNYLWLYPFFLAFNGGFADNIGNIIIDCEENIKTLQYLTKLVAQGGVPEFKNITDSRLLFATDHSGFLIDGPYARGHLREISGLGKQFDSHYGVVKIPQGISGRSESTLLLHSLAVSSQSRSLETACQLIEYMTSDEACAKVYFKHFGMIPPMRDLLHKPYFLSDPFASVFIDQLNTVTSIPINHPMFIKALPFINKVIANIIINQEEPQEKLKFLRDIMGLL